MGKKAIIIGAGVAGLTAAYYLEQDGYSIDILEKSDRIGGRIKTDEVDGFVLDHGFQVLLDAYPECQRLLDYPALNLHRFASGAIILYPDGSRSKVADPRRNFWSFIPTLMAKMGSIGDKFRLLGLAKKLDECYIDDLFEQPEEPTATYLNRKFGEEINQNFFYPFFRGIMLDQELKTSNRVFDFVFKMFGKGYATLPAEGMQALPKMIAKKLKRTTILLNSEVSSIQGNVVKTTDNQTFEGDKIIIATAGNGFVKTIHPSVNQRYVSNTTVYFSSTMELGTKDFLILNSKKDALVNHLVQMDNVSPSYAPKGQHLVACSLLGYHQGDDLIEKIKAELSTWFDNVGEWQHLKTYSIKYALPDQSHATNDLDAADALVNAHTYICGDHMLNGSINGAMKSGRQVAELIISSR